jgi:hypothetical protein
VGLILGIRRQLQLKLQLERIMMSPETTNIQLRALIAGGAPGARTLNQRIKSPLLYH